MTKVWRLFSILIIPLMCLGLMLVPGAPPQVALASGGVTVLIEDATTYALPSSSFTIDAVIDNPSGNEVAMHAVRLDFDPAYFTVDSVSLVDFPEDMGAPVINNTAGHVDYDPKTVVGTSINNTTIISARINCTAKALQGATTVSWVYLMGPPPRLTKVTYGLTDYLEGGNMSLMLNGTVLIGYPELTVDVVGQGNVSINGTIPSSYPNHTEWNWSDVVDLEAVEDVAGWTFDHWSGDLSGSTNPININMDADKNVTANFVRYYLTVTNSTGGTVTEPGVGTFGYAEDENVTLEAANYTGYNFVNWTGNVSTIGDVNASSTFINMTGNYSICANFVINQYSLTISSSDGGNVTTPGEGVKGPYNHGAVANLIATPDATYNFVNWTGDVGTIANATAANTTITMTGNYSIMANFALEQYNLTIDSTIGGNVTTPGEGVQGPYDHGTVLNLTATPDANYTFVNWTGNVSTIADVNSTTTNITMYANYSITANFALKQYNLTINSTIGGNVTTPGEGVKGPYDHGTVVNLTATPDVDYAFLGWSGNVSTIGDVNSSNTNITMYGNYSIIAHFGPHDFSARPISLTFTTDEGENPPSKTLEICNTGNGTLNWSLSDNAGWLSVAPTSGSLAEDDCKDVTVSVDVAGMKAGDYSATITITGSPEQEVPVSLHIESAMWEIPGGPAGFSASALSISPHQVNPGQQVTISINVANTGGETGSYNAILYINSVVEDSQSVSVAPGMTKNVIFTVSKSDAGVYDVSLAGQSGQFEVVGGGWFGGGLGTGGIVAIVVIVIVLILALFFVLRGTRREV